MRPMREWLVEPLRLMSLSDDADAYMMPIKNDFLIYILEVS